jgi:hypothetical protein
VFQVRDDTSEDIQTHLSKALEMALNAGGFVEGITSSIVTVIFKPPADSRERPVDAFLSKLGTSVRAVHGHGEFLRGTVGIPRRFAYGTIFPKFGRMLEILLHLEFGSSKEISTSLGQA